MKDKLKAIYGKLKLEQIEAQAKGFKQNSTNEFRKFIEALMYIELFKLWPENPMHKKSTFGAYILDVFNLRIKTYRNNKMALFNFPDESEKYGVGVIARIRRDCGATKVKTVLKQIKVKNGSLKTPITREQIDKIIENNTVRKATPKKNETERVQFWKEKALYWQKRALEAEALLKDKDEQIERQKSAIMNWFEFGQAEQPEMRA